MLAQIESHRVNRAFSDAEAAWSLRFPTLLSYLKICDLSYFLSGRPGSMGTTSEQISLLTTWLLGYPGSLGEGKKLQDTRTNIL